MTAVRTIRLPASEPWRPLNSMSEEIPPKPKPPRRRRRPSNKVDAPRPLSNRMDNPLVQLGRLQKHAAAITRLIRELPASELSIHGTLQALCSQLTTARELVVRMIEAQDDAE